VQAFDQEGGGLHALAVIADAQYHLAAVVGFVGAQRPLLGIDGAAAVVGIEAQFNQIRNALSVPRTLLLG
jgi:hypothetical protein